ncbi:MAG TPA: hypothetical protein VK463_09125 [Desulfomonilaceae bacterium]|nr:hypothetical protein [Desulfomonilaceae bacterium]
MNSLRSGMIVILILGSMIFLQGCGDSNVDKLRGEAEQCQKHVSNLESQLTQARDTVARQQAEKGDLVGQLDALRQKNRELEASAAKKAEPAREVTDAGKIGLMGAKAIAEFKAEQLSKRLDKLSSDLDAKEQELARINQLAKQKDAEVAELKARMEKLQAGDKNRVEELQARLDSISKELEQRSAAENKIRQDLQEKSELLAALKNAVADSAKLKSAAETELSTLRTELAQVSKQLETSKAQAAQEGKDLQDCAAWAEKADKELELRQAAITECRTDAERLRQEGEQLKAAVTELNTRIKAAESSAEDESTIDRILEAPKAGASANTPSSSQY